MKNIIKIVVLSLLFVANSYAAVYSKWASGEPNGSGLFGGGCVEITAAGTWNDRSCSDTFGGGSARYSCYNGVNWSLTRTEGDLYLGGSAAHTKCQELGEKYYFTAPFNNYENERLRKVMDAAGVGVAWINVNNSKSNLTFESAVQPPYITRWAGSNQSSLDEPDGGAEDCGSMDKAGFWYDEVCDVEPSEEKRYLCESDGTWFISAATGNNGRLYTAEKACRTDNASSTFGVPDSDTSNETIRNTIRGGMSTNEKIWINLNDRLVEGIHQSNENRYFWNVNEPNGNIAGSEECVVKSAGGSNRGWNDTTCSADRPYACYRHSTNTWEGVSVAGSAGFNLAEGIKACQEFKETTGPAYNQEPNQFTFWAPKDPTQNGSAPTGSWLNIQWDTSSSEWLVNRDATHWGATVVNDKDGDGYNVTFRTIPEPNNGVFPAHAVQTPSLNSVLNEDCASQQGNGSWYDLSCSRSMKFACYNAVNNDWQLASASSNLKVYSGEFACQSVTEKIGIAPSQRAIKSHKYHFTAPGTRQQQTDLALKINKVAVWVNGTDRTEESHWRYNQFLTFWAGEGIDSNINPEQPIGDDTLDCAVADGVESALWFARSCAENHEYLCKNGDDWVLADTNNIAGTTKQSGQEACKTKGLFLAPHTLLEQEVAAAVIGSKEVWINASDEQIEGTWKINELHFWKVNQPDGTGDCAVMQNADGLWDTADCSAGSQQYLCLDTVFGNWVSSVESGNMTNFANGQNACEAMNNIDDQGEIHEFIFAAPSFTWENDAAKNAISTNVWINGNDRITPDLWVFNEFLYWRGDALNDDPDNKDCLTVDFNGHWLDTSCDTTDSYQVACYSGDGWYLSPASINVSNFNDAQQACNAIGQGYRFFSPISVADNRELRALISEGSRVWINGIDIAEEGKWVFNSQGLPTPNWATDEPRGKTVKNCAFVNAVGLWYADECTGDDSKARQLVCKKLDGTLVLSSSDSEKKIKLTSNFDEAQATTCDSVEAGATFYAPTTFNENEALRKLIPSGEEVWVNASDEYIEARWALNIASMADYDAVSPNTDSVDGCVYYDDKGRVVSTSCNTQARAVTCSNGFDWKVSNRKVLLGTTPDVGAPENGALIRNAFGVCQQEFSGDYTFATPENTANDEKWKLAQALALSGKASAWLNMADWFVPKDFSSNMPYQNIISNPVQANTGCAFVDGVSDGWLVEEVCDAVEAKAHFACFNGSVWKVAPANGTIDEPAKPQRFVDAWDQGYGDLRCREFFGQSYNFSVPISPKEDVDLKQVVSRLGNANKKTWINYYSNRLWNGLNGQQWFADRINLNVFDGIQLDRNATTEDCGSITRTSGNIILTDDICSITKKALCFDGTTWSQTNVPESWNKASAQCGLDLGEQHVFAIPRDSLERSQVTALLTDGESLWVNYSDISVESKWRANLPVRQWWADAEPTNRGNRDCVVMGGVGSGLNSGEWRSDYCDQVFHQYACKRGTAWKVIGLDGLNTSEGGIWAQGFSACRKIPFADAADEAKGSWHFDFPEDYFANLATATTIAAGTIDNKDFDNGDAALTTALTNTTAWLNLTDQYREKDWQRGRQFSDWAAGFAFDDNKDCAFVDTVSEEINGKSVKGTWHPGLCYASESSRKYACTNGLNWAVADAILPATGNNWLDGFAACKELLPKNDWTFAAPVTSFDNERLKAAIGKGTVWINLQDVSADGDWAANLNQRKLPPIIKFVESNKVGKINEITVAEQSSSNTIRIEVIDPEDSELLSVVVTVASDSATITSPALDPVTSLPTHKGPCKKTCDFDFVYSAGAAANTIKSLKFKVVAKGDSGLSTTTYFDVDVIPAIIAWYDFNDANKPNYDKTGNGNDANDVPELPYDFPPIKNGAIEISSGTEKMTVDGPKLNMPKDYAIALRIWADADDASEYQSFQIKYEGTNQCFDLEGTGKAAAQVGKNVAMYTCDNASDQKWYQDEDTGLIHSDANNAVCLSYPDDSSIKLSYCATVQHPWTINSDGSIESKLIPGYYLYAASPSNDENVVLSTSKGIWETDKSYGRGILQKGPVANQPLLTFGDKTSKLTYTVGDTSGTTVKSLKEEQWVNVVVNVLGNQLTLFVDGVKENAVTLSGPAVKNDDNLIIGDIPSALRSFIGRIDDVQVFSRPLTDAEVVEILPEPPIGLVQFESASIVRQEPQVEGASLANPVLVRRTDGSNGHLRAWYKTHEKTANEGVDYLGLDGTEALNELVWSPSDEALYLTPEYGLLPLLSSSPRLAIDSVELDRTQPVFVAIDLTIPSNPEGVLWEQGGSGQGAFVGFNAANELVVRAGSGGALPNNETARIIKNKAFVDSNLANKSGTLFVEINPDPAKHLVQAWFKNGGLFGEAAILSLGTNTSVDPFPSNEWQGGDPGMVGNKDSSLVLGEYSGGNTFNARYIRNSISGSTSNGSVHWVEIEAFNTSNVNVALNVTGITASNDFLSTKPKEFITNGNFDTNQYAEINGTANTVRWVQVDLGAERTLKSVNVRHYYGDPRSYNNNKTEYSVDGTTWFVLRDFTLAPYAEVAAGKALEYGFPYNGTITMARFYNQASPEPIERIVENAKLAKVTLSNESPFEREPTERFDLELIKTASSADGTTWASFPEGTSGSLNQTEIKLLDYTKNPQGILQFSKGTYQCSEPHAGSNSGTGTYGNAVTGTEDRLFRDCFVEVQRRTGDRAKISVEYGISGNGIGYAFLAEKVTKTTDVLFTSSDLKLTFDQGVRSQKIHFKVLAELGVNNRYENNEEFTLTLFNPYNEDLGDAPWLGDPVVATVVMEDYAVGVVDVEQITTYLAEPLQSKLVSHIKTVYVRRSEGSNGVAKVEVSIPTSQATRGTDYDLLDEEQNIVPGSGVVDLTWKVGQQSSLPVFIKIYSDKYQEVIPFVTTGAGNEDDNCFDGSGNGLPDNLDRDCSNGESFTLQLTKATDSDVPLHATRTSSLVYIRDNTAPAVIGFTATTMAYDEISEVMTADTVDNGNGVYDEGTDTVADQIVKVEIERSNKFSQHAVWLYVKGVINSASIAANFLGVNTTVTPNRNTYDAMYEAPLVRNGRVAGEYKYLWVLPLVEDGAVPPRNSDLTLTTNVTQWQQGGTAASNLANIIDGVVNSAYQVHPNSAQGKWINFSWSNDYQGGSVVFHNRNDGCCRARIAGSRMEFFLDGSSSPVHQFDFTTANSNADVIHIPIPANVKFDRMRLVFTSAGDGNQNFREIEIFSTVSVGSTDVHSVDIKILDNWRNDQRRNLEFSIEAASDRDAAVIDLGAVGSNSSVEVADIEITEQNLPPVFVDSATDITVNFPSAGSGMSTSFDYRIKNTNSLYSIRAVDPDWINVNYTMTPSAASNETNTQTYNAKNDSGAANDRPYPVYDVSHIAREWDYVNAPYTAKKANVSFVATDSEGESVSHNFPNLRVAPQWRQIVIAADDECMYPDDGRIRWGYSTKDNCDAGEQERMWWLAIPQGTTPETYQLVNRLNKQCMYISDNTGRALLRDCVGGADEQWVLGNSDPFLRKFKNGSSGTLRNLCAKGAAGFTGNRATLLVVDGGCPTGYWGNIRWR